MNVEPTGDTATWASLEDFAVLFRYLWMQDFPASARAIGARRADWTIHIGVVVRRIADLLGLYARFESGGRTDAVLRRLDGNVAHDVVAIEWEWEGVYWNEIKKLRAQKDVSYAVFISYSQPSNLPGAIEHVACSWQSASFPLLLVVIDFVPVGPKEAAFTRRQFGEMHFYRVDGRSDPQPLGSYPALPWRVSGSKWEEGHESPSAPRP